jgi:hypothetical protein
MTALSQIPIHAFISAQTMLHYAKDHLISHYVRICYVWSSLIKVLLSAYDKVVLAVLKLATIVM